MTRKKKPTETGDAQMKKRAQALGLHGLVTHWETISQADWVPQLLDWEEAQRTARSLERRIKAARLGLFKSMPDFDWKWPQKIDRTAIDEVFKANFFDEGVNTVLLGPNGVGKTMLLKNLAHHCVLRGHTVRFATASSMLNDLAAQQSTAALNRSLRLYVNPDLLCVDEVGYLSYDARYADLLFEVVTRRYEAQKPIVLTTNKPFSEWPSVFPNATCVVTLVDRLIHRCEVISIEGSSFRMKEAKERAARKRKLRRND